MSSTAGSRRLRPRISSPTMPSRRRWRASGSMRGTGCSGSGTPRNSSRSGSSPVSSLSRSNTVPAIFRRACSSLSCSLMPKYARMISRIGSSGTTLPWASPCAVDGDAARTAALHELVAEAALARFGLGDHAHDLTIALERARQGCLQARHLGLAPHEAREPAGARDLQARAHRPHAFELIDLQRLVYALDGGRPEIGELEETRDQARRVLGQVGAVRRRDRVHASGEADGVPIHSPPRTWPSHRSRAGSEGSA